MQHAPPGPRRRNLVDHGAAAKKLGLRSTEIADRNVRVILEAIRRHGPSTRLELAHRTGLTGPGITNILRRLSDGGFIAPLRRREAQSRSFSTEFGLNPNGAFSIGLRMGDGRGEAVLIDLSGQIRDRLDFDPEDKVAVAETVRTLSARSPAAERVIGVGVATNRPEDIEALKQALPGMRLLSERDCVAALLVERTIGAGVPEGGLVMIVINEGVQAGLLVRGVPFSGVHGRAGGIGAMRTGPDHVRLDSIVGLHALRTILETSEFDRLVRGEEMALSPALRGWIKNAAGHLLDAIVALAGFVAPGAILIGGDLPRNVIEALIHQISIERRDTTIRPFSTPWISPILPASFDGGGIAIGAALLPFFDTLLPSPMAS